MTQQNSEGRNAVLNSVEGRDDALMVSRTVEILAAAVKALAAQCQLCAEIAPWTGQWNLLRACGAHLSEVIEESNGGLLYEIPELTAAVEAISAWEKIA